MGRSRATVQPSCERVGATLPGFTDARRLRETGDPERRAIVPMALARACRVPSTAAGPEEAPPAAPRGRVRLRGRDQGGGPPALSKSLRSRVTTVRLC